mmetsp:Transcript_5715/g.13734  ORF Transcript_5715/g.13734 Transcript_5715/m.13734 type:complete len:184 (+) Transcript_5715:137-688(+)
MSSAHTRWVAFSVLGSTGAVLCLGLDRFVPGGQFAPGLLSQSDHIEATNELEKQLHHLKAAVKQLTQAQVALDQFRFSMRVFVHVALFGSFIVFKHFILAKTPAVRKPEDSLGDSMGDLLEDSSGHGLHQALEGMKEKQVETAEKIAFLEQRAHNLRQDVREELRRVRQLAGISAQGGSRAQA